MVERLDEFTPEAWPRSLVRDAPYFRKDLVFADAAMKGHWSDRAEFTRMVAMATRKPPELSRNHDKAHDRSGRIPLSFTRDVFGEGVLYRSLSSRACG